MPFPIYFSDIYTFPISPTHRFPAGKYAKTRELLLADQIISPDQLIQSTPIDPALIRSAHDSNYVHAFLNGTLDDRSIRRIGLPWSPEYAMRVRATLGGTLAAAEAALACGVAGNLAGGTHHAMADRGEGFCVFNDIAVAARVMLERGMVERVGVIDLDVHQGNGTAAILGDDPRVHILDLYARSNYPYRKVPATLDIPLDDGMRDDEYLALLDHALDSFFAKRHDIIFYQAGVDLLEADRLGRLSLSADGVMERDRMVLARAASLDVPIVLTLGGGYAKPIEISVAAYAGTYRVAMEVGWGP